MTTTRVSTTVSRLVAALALTATATSALAGPFSLGNLVVVRVGANGSLTSLNSAAFSTFLEEYTPSGTLVQTIPMPTTVSGAQRRLVLSGSAASEGQLTLSADGQYLTFGGYDADAGLASIATTTSANVNRVVARIGFNGVVDTSTTTTAFSGNSIRGVVSNDGGQFWMTGGTNGVQYASPLGASSSIQINTAVGTPTNNRNVNIFGGQLYISSASGVNKGISTVGSGLPTVTGQSTSLFPGTGGVAANSGYDFAIISSTLLYMADDSATAGVGGLQRWELVGGTWTRTQTWAPANSGRTRQLTNTTNAAGQNILYVTVLDAAGIPSIQSLTDIGALSVFSTVASGSVNTVYRGIDFAPIPTPGSLALLGLGALVVNRRRR